MWQNGDKHVTNYVEMWQNFWHMLETAQPCGLWGFWFCHIFVPDVTNFVTIVWCIKVFVTFLTDMPFCLCKFVPSLSHLTLLLWQILSNFCPGLSHFLDFYTFFMHKMYILAFCPIFVTFFVTWDKFCHIFNTSETQ